MDWLERLRKGVLWRRFIGVFVVHACILGVILGVICASDALVSSLSEEGIGYGFGGACCLLLLSFVGWVWRVHGRCTLSALARDLDRALPDAGNSIDSAREVWERGAQNEVEQLLVDRVSGLGASRGGELSRLMLRGVSWCRLAWLGLILCGGLSLVWHWPRAGEKFLYWLGDVRRGESSGLVIRSSASDGFVVSGADVDVHVEVKRWEKDQATILLRRDGARGVETYALHPQEGTPGAFAFTLYDVRENGSYKVQTPSLSSGWRQYQVYERPVISDVRVQVVPPAYTGESSQEGTELTAIAAPVRSRLRLAFRLRHGSAPRLQLAERGALPLAENGERHEGDVLLETSGRYVLTVEDARRHPVELAEFEVTLRADMPPSVERREPPGDVRVEEGDSVRLSAAAVDDYGLTSFRFEYQRMSGVPEGRELLAPGETGAREASWSDEWQIADAGLSVGDIVACRFVAADNGEPESQTRRSEVFFVTVVPRRSSSEQDAGSSEKQEEERVDISDLVLEAKRLLRRTWDLLDYDEAPSSEVHGLVSSLGDLRVEVQRREQQFCERGKVLQLPEPLRGFFRQAVDALSQAEVQMAARALTPSRQQQEVALAALTRLESELLKNEQKSQKSKSRQESSESGGDQGEEQEQKQKEGEEGEPDERLLAVLTESLETLRAVERAQTQLGGRLARSGEKREALEQRQQELRRQAGDVSQRLVEFDAAQAARRLLEESRQEMNGVLGGLRQAERQVASLRSARAAERLQATCAALEELMRGEGARQVKALADKAEKLSEKQRELAGRSGELASQRQQGRDSQASRQQAREAQQQVKQQTEALRQQIRQRAEALRGMWPETAQALEKSAESMTAGDIAGQQTKAGNALLYRRYDRASAEQQQAGEKLSRVAGELKQTAQAMPSFNLEELRQQIARMQQATEALKQAQSQETATAQWQRARHDAGQQTQKLAEMLQDERLREMSGRISGQLNEGEELSGQGAFQLAQEALKLAVEHLLKLEGQQQTSRLLKSRRSAPPERYQRSVEEYFKQLAR